MTHQPPTLFGFPIVESDDVQKQQDQMGEIVLAPVVVRLRAEGDTGVPNLSGGCSQ